MFDDTPQQGSAGSVPPNLPTGEPEDIFASVKEPAGAPVPSTPPQQSTTPLGGSATVPDQVDTKTALSAGVLKPKGESHPQDMTGHTPLPPMPPRQTPSMPPAPQMPPVATNMPPPQTPQSPLTPPATLPDGGSTHTMPSDAPEIYSLKEPKVSKGIITGVIILVVLALLGVGGLFLYTQFIASPAQEKSIDAAFGEGSNTTLDTDPFDTVTPGNADNIDTVTSTVTTSTDDAGTSQDDIIFGEPNDTDADGLDDARERGIGTDPAHWDSDGDELSDGDEVIIWKTDPLNPDTDGDTYPDGQEVKSGYNPNGPGKIFETETAEEMDASTTATSS